MTADGGDRNIQELKSLVLSTLETNGVLGQIRAQLRANVYKAIDCDEEQVAASASPGHSKLMKSPHGRLIAEIVAEFFLFYDFRHSLSVFIPEAGLGRERRSRNDVVSDAGLSDVAPDLSILEQLIAAAAAFKVDQPQGEQLQQRQQRQKPQQKLQQKQQKQLQKQHKLQSEGVEESQVGSAVVSMASPSPGPQPAPAESSMHSQVSEGVAGAVATWYSETQSAHSGNDRPAAATPHETTTEKAATKAGVPSKTDEGKAAATRAALISTAGSSAQEECNAKDPVRAPERQDPQEVRLADAQDRRATRSEEPSLADSLGGPATTHDSFDEEFDRKMEEQIDSKIQRVNSCAAGDIATTGLVGTGEPMSPEVVDTVEPAVADSTGEISLDGSASESGQPQDLRRATSAQSQSSPRSSHHSGASEDASPANHASQSSPLASQSISPSVSNESLRSPAHSSHGSHSQGSLQQPNAEGGRRKADSRLQEASLHSEPDGGGGHGAVSGGSSGSSAANARHHSRLGLGDAGRGSFAEDSEQEEGDSISMSGSMSKSSGDLDPADGGTRRPGPGSRSASGGNSTTLWRSGGGRAASGDAAAVSADEESFTSSRSSISGASEPLQSHGSDDQF